MKSKTKRKKWKGEGVYYFVLLKQISLKSKIYRVTYRSNCHFQKSWDNISYCVKLTSWIATFDVSIPTPFFVTLTLKYEKLEWQQETFLVEYIISICVIDEDISYAKHPVLFWWKHILFNNMDKSSYNKILMNIRITEILCHKLSRTMREIIYLISNNSVENATFFIVCIVEIIGQYFYFKYYQESCSSALHVFLMRIFYCIVLLSKAEFITVEWT